MDPEEENIPMEELGRGREEEDVREDEVAETNPDDVLNVSVPVISVGYREDEDDTIADVRRVVEEDTEMARELKSERLKTITGKYLKYGVGPNSSTLFNRLSIRTNARGEILGADFKDGVYGRYRKLFKRDGGNFVFSRDKGSENAINDYKSLFEKAVREYDKSVESDVEDRAGAQITQSTITEIVHDSVRDLRQEISERGDAILDEIEDAGFSAELTREITGTISQGTANEHELGLSGEERTRHLETRLKALVGPKISERESSEKTQWLDRARDEEKKALDLDAIIARGGTLENLRNLENKKEKHLWNKKLFEELANICDLQADEIRLKFGLKPESERALEILRSNTDSDPRTSFEKFRRWVKRNLGGISLGAITVAGIITTIAVGFRGAVKTGARATSAFARGVYKVLKKMGPVFKILGKVLLNVLSWGAKGLLFISENMWILAVAFGYFLYEKNKRG